MGKQSFYVAGLGASAGGHQALKEFFQHIPNDPGIAFCVVTHLLRAHNSILDKILSRYTSLKVCRMQHLQPVKPNHVYVMPEGVKAYIHEGFLVLRPRHIDEKVNKTVDEFFYSLAEDQGNKAIGIVFSGMGDDGADGAQVIHDHGGTVLVQEPDSTPFKSMPESVIKRDHPEKILSPSMLAKNLVAHIAQKAIAVK
jgi:two-component system, chemotaxis family, protein-glutamate methylesterase/glutaminase